MRRDPDRSAPVMLKIYLRPDLAEVMRVLQALVRLPIVVERFDAHLSYSAIQLAGNRDRWPGPFMRVAVVGSIDGARDVERVTKALNKVVSVYKVIVMDMA